MVGKKEKIKPTFMDMLDAADLRAARKARTLNQHFESSGSIGKYLLPHSNNIPIQYAMETKLLPHTQIRTQDFQLMALKDQEPVVTADVRELIYYGTTIRVPVLRAHTHFTSNDLSKAFASYLVPFLTPANNYPNEAYIVSAITLFATLDPNLSAGALNAALANKDITIELVETYDILVYLGLFPYYGSTSWAKATRDICDRLGAFEPVLAKSGVALQTFGKQVTDSNGEKWYTNRFKALCSVLNVDGRESFDDYRPTVNSLAKANNAISTAFYLRRLFVDRMFMLKRGKNKVADMFAHVLQLLSCTDITHVVTIDTYVVKTLPEVMNLPLLRQYESNLLAMYEFWAKHRAIFPYVRFYIPQEECSAIQRDQLQPLTAAAFAVGSYVNESFKNYRGPMRESSLFKTVHAEVTRYLESRLSLAGITLASSDRATISDIEREELFKKLLAGGSNETYTAVVRDLESLKKDLEDMEE